MNFQLLVPDVMSIENTSFAATASGEDVSVVNVETVPEAVPAATVGALEKPETPFLLMVKVSPVLGSEAFTATRHFVTLPARGAIISGPMLVPGVPLVTTKPTARGTMLTPSIWAMNFHADEPEVMSMENTSFAVTARGEEVRAVKVETVPEAVAAAIVGALEKMAVPFCLMVKVSGMAGSEAFVTTTHCVTVPV